MSSKKDLNEKYLSFLDQTKDDTHKAVNHLNDRVLIVDGLNTFIRSFAVNPALNEDGLHIGGMVGFMKSVRYTCDILKPSRCIIVFDGKGGSKKSGLMLRRESHVVVKTAKKEDTLPVDHASVYQIRHLRQQEK